MAETIKHKAVSGVFWRLFEQGGRQIIQFGISIILARLIAPDQFGMIAMLTVFISVANCFVDSGLGQALFIKKERTQVDCSTVFWFSLIASVICYGILYLGAPLVSRFYNMQELTPILRVSSLSIIIGTLGAVNRMFLEIDLDFKTLAKYNIAGLVISGAVGIALAYCDFKVWALVYQNLTMTIITTFFIIIKVKWLPSFVFSKTSFREFFTFGVKMLASRILDTIYTNIYAITIGKFYRSSELAFYNRAQQIKTMTSSLPTGILQSVTFPLLVNLKGDDELLKNAYRRIIRISAFVIFPLCLGVGAVAYPLINTLFTDIWIYAATILSIVVFAGMWYPIHAINLNYLIVKGRSDLFLRLEIIKKIVGVIILCITIPMGIEAMCYGSVISSFISLILNTYYTGKFLKMTIFNQLRDILPTMVLSGVMYVCVRLLANYMGNDITSLICSIAVGVVIFAGGALLFKFPEVNELKALKK